MLKFICIIRPHKAELLCERLLVSGLVNDLSAEEIIGRGRRIQGLQQVPHRASGEGSGLEYLPKVIVSAYIEDVNKDAVADIIQSASRSGHSGDGKIFFTNVESYS